MGTVSKERNSFRFPKRPRFPAAVPGTWFIRRRVVRIIHAVNIDVSRRRAVNSSVPGWKGVHQAINRGARGETWLSLIVRGANRKITGCKLRTVNARVCAGSRHEARYALLARSYIRSLVRLPPCLPPCFLNTFVDFFAFSVVM